MAQVFLFEIKIHIKFTILNHFKLYNLVYSQCCVTITTIKYQNIFIDPPKKALFPFLQLAITNLFSVFWTFLINGIIQYVIFCVWLLSRSTFSMLIYTVACTVLHSVLWLNNTSQVYFCTLNAFFLKPQNRKD